jgi:hypothetical protein
VTKAVYQITASAVDTVKVGSYLIDQDLGKRYTWGLYDSATGNFSDGFSGVRTDRVCVACWNLPERKVARHGHVEPHGEAPTLTPSPAKS